MKKGKNKLIFIFFTCLLIQSCKQKGRWDSAVNYNKGEITVLCDESFQSILTQQKEVYEASYPDTKINLEFLPEGEILTQLLAGKKRIAVLGRKLSADEFANLKRIDSVVPFEYLIAKDAIALISSTHLEKTIYTLTEIENYFSAKNTSVHLVFDNKQSGSIKYMLNKLKITQLNSSLFALSGVDSVVNYISKTDQGIGFIPYAEISDLESQHTKQVLNKVKVLTIQTKDSLGKTLTTTASQSEISTEEYPFHRPINYILCNAKEPLGTGFVNFLFSTRGAKIFLKDGLIPSKIPERIIQIESKNLTPNVEK